MKPRVLERFDPKHIDALARGDLAEAERIKQGWEGFEGWVPILGSGVAAYEALEEGKISQAAFHAAMAAGEAVGVGLIAKGAKGAKLVVKGGKQALQAVKAVTGGVEAAAEGAKALSELGLKNGMKVSSSRALELGEQFLGKGYKELIPGSGRYVSADGTRVFRMGTRDILGKHGAGPHVNLEIFIPNPAKSGKMMRINNFHIYLTD
ncbi:MAG: hypothetical protein AAF400_00420 [Bacteroidota bacterium]